MVLKRRVRAEGSWSHRRLAPPNPHLVWHPHMFLPSPPGRPTWRGRRSLPAGAIFIDSSRNGSRGTWGPIGAGEGSPPHTAIVAPPLAGVDGSLFFFPGSEKHRAAALPNFPFPGRTNSASVWAPWRDLAVGRPVEPLMSPPPSKPLLRAQRVRAKEVGCDPCSRTSGPRQYQRHH